MDHSAADGGRVAAGMRRHTRNPRTPVPEIEIASDINGRVWKIEAAVGAAVAAGETLLILESMKMEIPVEAPQAGRVARILVAEGADIVEGQVLAVVET
ncbi:MAG TPA: acetyl-CoA carboxylase biotin carboxyl carrier protein subunit [Caulobacteraceae bacterium]